MNARAVRLIATLLGLALALAAVGCARASVPEPEPVPAPTPTETTPAEEPAPETETTSVKLYLVRGEKLGVAGREVEVPKDAAPEDVVSAALTALFEGPSSQDEGFGFSTTIPDGASLNGVTVRAKVATVDVDQAYTQGGGSLSMQLRVAQVVFTATQLPEVERVAFTVDGEPVEAIGGEGVMVSPPVDRADFEAQLPPIFLESPVPGQQVSSPIALEGSANVFEAQFNAKVSNTMGDKLAEIPVKAESGTGTRGAFAAEIGYDIAGPGVEKGVVTVFDYSEKDGSVVDRVDVPVLLAP